MIKNERQYRLAKSHVADVLGSIEDVRSEFADKPAIVQDVYVAALINSLSQIQEEVAEYETARDGHEPLEAHGLGALPVTLIRARIRKGWTQKDLANRLGTSEQQVQRWESRDYHNITLERLERVSEMLDVQVSGRVPVTAAANQNVVILE